ncbi:MAG: KGK domain-containing protein [Oscillatoriales cyanobacterium C42_A2020_001]|nr:KGK domain-containing protein [Leptolyngbyaceae cyanobacterium C42_A2020_001]
MNEFQPLSDDEVLYVSLGRVLMSNPTFKVGEFLDALAQAISDREDDWSDDNEGWFSDGLECEALRFNAQGWQRGRVRIRLEFAPDGPRPQLPERRTSHARRPEKIDPRTDDIYRLERDEGLRSERPRLELDDIYRGPDDEY